MYIQVISEFLSTETEKLVRIKLARYINACQAANILYLEADDCKEDTN